MTKNQKGYALYCALLESTLSRHFRQHTSLDIETYVSYCSWANHDATMYVHDEVQDAKRLSKDTLEVAKTLYGGRK